MDRYKVTEVEYLTVNINSELPWSPQVNHTAEKVNQSLAFLCRNSSYYLANLKVVVYVSLVCSILEYCSWLIWDPHLNKDRPQLDKTQRRA